MKYLDPIMRTVLAGEYVLGILSSRARDRFERLMRSDAALARLAGEWSDYFSPIDASVLPVEPPARVWRAVAERTRPGNVVWFRPRGFAWTAGFALAAGVVLAVLINLSGVMSVSRPKLDKVVAVLTENDGFPAWIVRESKDRQTLSVESVRDWPIATKDTFELWAIADGKPSPLGLVAAAPQQRVMVPTNALPHKDGVLLAISFEPPGGSPTGLPTGPVLCKGPLFED